MKTLLVIVIALAAVASTVDGAEIADRLLRTPVTQMDYGLGQMAAVLAPVLGGLGASCSVIWVEADSKIEVRASVVAPPGDGASWEPAREVAAAVRRTLGVDPMWGKLHTEGDGELSALFALVAGEAPSSADLAQLVRLRVAVRRTPTMSPTFYVGDLLDDDVHLAVGPSN